MVLSSRPVYPRARSLHPSSGALPSGFVARSCQPVLSLTSISTQKHFSLNLEYLEVKFYVILTSRFLHRCLHEQNSSQRGSLMKRENSTWCIQSLGNFIVFYQYHLWNIYFFMSVYTQQIQFKHNCVFPGREYINVLSIKVEVQV